MTGFPHILLPVVLFAAVPVHTAGLPDTGQALCDNGSNVLVACSAGNTGDAAKYPRQDGRFGRDAKAAAGTLTKVGGGAAGFDYTKVAHNGSDLAAGAAQGTGATDWACTRDNITGLTWEMKTSTPITDVHNSGHTYTWYNSNSATNGGNAGDTGSNTCFSTLPGGLCNTEALVNAVNGAALCSYIDWRLPTPRELQTVVHHGVSFPSIDTTYFPNTPSQSHFWSASSYVPNPALAWIVDFTFGLSAPDNKAGSNKVGITHVRLVRGGQF